MRILELHDTDARHVDHFGSQAFSIARIAAGETHVALARLGAGGCIGRHPAMSQQLLVVITGSAIVSGADGLQATLGPGEAAVWEAGEEHETRTNNGLTAVIVEGSIDL